MKNLEELGVNDPKKADGIIRYALVDPKSIRVIVTVKNKVDCQTMARFERTLGNYLKYKNHRGSILKVQTRIFPKDIIIVKWVILLESPSSNFKERFCWLIECLKQTQVITVPFILNLSKQKRLHLIKKDT